MEIRQLSYVEAVARYGGFTRAAERLHVAQSAVSSQVRALEVELGVTLFARTTRKVALTPAGEMFVARARRILAELDGARGEMTEITAVVSGRVLIGATAALGPYDLAGALAKFRDRHPQIAVRLRSGRITGLLGACDNGELDLVVGPMYADLPPRFDAVPLADERLLLALPPGHALAHGGRLTLGEVRDEPFVSMPPGSGLRWILEDAARSAGFLPRVYFETHSLAGVRELVGAGLGVGLLSRTVAAEAGPVIAVRQLHPPPAHPPIGVMHQRNRPLSVAAQSLRHHLVEVAGRDLPGSAEREARDEMEALAAANEEIPVAAAEESPGEESPGGENPVRAADRL
ncbi:LysR family transcriptional regulator [Actinoplanes italicus]|uniref:DNA-binding transcriptional LysR family regulator n=1 Tax=Actinoplanes italicus TaxID=113567 RepID=A0A2T0K7Q1_9ACTN|nr:LysR family transcriptional regulator [Actinoplanes italicus]PRX19039.1 DNA-binding transcriptional LysR family regulator [Actinoplanes italicus]GIE32382.1 LysR family transcriptional regulator [Actinoplanes italicus]